MNNIDPNIEDKARQILEKTDTLRTPIPINLVAHRLELGIEKTLFTDEVSGVLYTENGKGVIGFNTNHNQVRQRFTIAHEIGHFLLHYNSNQDIFIDKSYKVYKRDHKSSSGEYRKEIEANRFAAALLMPTSLVNQEAENFDLDLGDEVTLQNLANKFQVSIQAMTFRLVNLGIISENLI